MIWVSRWTGKEKQLKLRIRVGAAHSDIVFLVFSKLGASCEVVTGESNAYISISKHLLASTSHIVSSRHQLINLFDSHVIYISNSGRTQHTCCYSVGSTNWESVFENARDVQHGVDYLTKADPSIALEREENMLARNSTTSPLANTTGSNANITSAIAFYVKRAIAWPNH